MKISFYGKRNLLLVIERNSAEASYNFNPNYALGI